jgi:tetratricopeptide (TPR) repeat protein
MKTRVFRILLAACCIFTATYSLRAMQKSSHDPAELFPDDTVGLSTIHQFTEKINKDASKEDQEAIRCFFECCEVLFKSDDGYDSQALGLIQETKKKYPNLALPCYCEGRIFTRLGKQEEAKTAFNRAIELDAEFAEAYARRAVVLMELSTANLPLATEDLKKAAALHPDMFIVTLSQGWVCSKDGRYADAMPYFDRASSKFSVYPYPSFYRGCNYLQLGKPDKAIEDFSHALSITPEAADLLAARAYAYVQASQAKKAIEDCNKAIGLCDADAHRYTDRPNFLGTAYFYRGMAYSQIGNLDLAAADFDKAIPLTEGEVTGSVYFSQGLLKKAQGDTPGAIQALSTATRFFVKNEKSMQMCKEKLEAFNAESKSAQDASDVGKWITQHPVATGIAALLGLAIVESINHQHEQGHDHQEKNAGGTESCPDCAGSGYVQCPTCLGSGKLAPSGQPCPTCGGNGMVRCPRCGGSGIIFH